MRSPRASAVVVALSTFVAVVTIAALASQLAPVDRAGAILPDGPITVEGQPGLTQPTPTVAPDEAAPTEDSSSSAPDAGPSPGGSSATVVDPAPPETVTPEPEPSGPPENPGNSANAPGQDGTPGNSGDKAGGRKP